MSGGLMSSESAIPRQSQREMVCGSPAPWAWEMSGSMPRWKPRARTMVLNTQIEARAALPSASSLTRASRIVSTIESP